MTSLWWVRSLYVFFTQPVATHGGQYVEAMIAQPRFINPLLAPASSSTDKALTRLIYSGLFAYDAEGLLKMDLAERFEQSGDAKEYVVYLRQDATWHDGEPFGADDVLYTINTAKNVDYGAVGVLADIRLAFRDVSIKKRDAHTVVFTLKEPRADFLHVLTLGILPEHIWRNVSLQQFNTTDFNVKPIGTGPYSFVDVHALADGTVQEYVLRAYEGYYKGEPYITKFSFRLYPDRDHAVAAYNSGEIGGVTIDTPEQDNMITAQKTHKQHIAVPSYYAVFFNQTKSVPLAYDDVRAALVMGIDRRAIIDAVFGDFAQDVRAPLLAGMNGYSADFLQPEQAQDQARQKLESAGWKVGDDGVRFRGGDKLTFTLTVRDDQKQLVRVAELLQEQWKAIGARVDIRKVRKDELATNVIKPHEYDAVLMPHPLRWDQPRLRQLWHSDFREGTGKNYALFKDAVVDRTLDDLEKTTDLSQRATEYLTIQKRILAEDPALFLFAPGFVFAHTDKLHGSGTSRANVSSDRFSDVSQWYVQEKREWKK